MLVPGNGDYNRGSDGEGETKVLYRMRVSSAVQAPSLGVHQIKESHEDRGVCTESPKQEALENRDHRKPTFFMLRPEQLKNIQYICCSVIDRNNLKLLYLYL